MKCPVCGDSFDSEFGMKVHHKLKHDESLSKEVSQCTIEGCSNEFKYYPSEKDGLICSECVDSGKTYIHSESISKDDIDYNTVERVEDECCYCGCTIIVKENVLEDNNYCSNKCVYKKHSERMSGSNNPRYIDGESSGKSYNSKWRSVKKEVKLRDENECQVCGSGKNLHGHHIKPVENFDEEDNAHFKENVILVCASCHRNIEYGNIEIPESVIEEKNLVRQPDSYKFQKV